MNELVVTLKKLILKESASAVDLAMQGLSENETQFLVEVRKKGVLRCSTYNFQTRELKRLVDKILLEATISEYASNYFLSIKSLIFAGIYIQKIYRSLIRELDQGDIKSYLASLDSLFWKSDSLSKIDDDITNIGLKKEDYAAAFSFLFFKANEQRKLNESQLNQIDIRNIRKEYFLNKLSEFYKIIEFREIEILVDYFDYRVTSNKRKIFVEAPSIDLEKSITLGYINRHNQHLADSASLIIGSNYPSKYSLIKACQDLAIQLKDEIFQINSDPEERITMALPNSHELIDLIDEESLFEEENIAIELIKKELFIDFDQIKKVNFYKDLNLLDIIRFQRLFLVLYYAFNAYIESEKLFNSKLFWRSILPVFHRNEFLKILRRFFNRRKADQLLSLMCWDPNSDGVLDIQYQPILSIGQWLIVPLGIVHCSHLPRNVLSHTRYRFDNQDTQDPVGEILESALQPVSSFIQREFPYKFNGRTTKIDVIAVIDNNIFIFECKNSLYPTSPFELRSSYEYVKKGAKQLNYFLSFWKDDSFRKYIANKIQNQGIKKLYTCIVTGNRMFSGWKEQGHSIRTIYEMQNFIKNGKISVPMLDIDEKTLNTQTINLWKANYFQAEDLIAYIEQDSLHNIYFSSMQEREYEINLGNVAIVTYKYALNMNQFQQKMSSAFRLIDAHD